MNKSSFIYGTFILISSNLIVRLISFSYDVTLSRMIGAEGIGIFHMVMPLLMMFLIITTGGIPTAVSKLVSEQDSINNTYGNRKVFKISFLITLFITIILIFLVFINAGYFSKRIYKTNENTRYIYLLIPPILFISFTCLIRGYFYGKKKILISSISEVIEHVSRFILVMILIYYLKPLSIKDGAIIAILGISIGEFFSLLWLAFNYIKANTKKISLIQNKISSLNILRKISIIAIPLTLSGIFNVSFGVINAILLPQKLMESGYSNSEAIASFGRIMGMTMPLVTLPFIVTSAIVINIIPSLSSCFRMKRYNKARKDICYALKITFLVSIPLTLLYVFFSEEISIYLYKDIETSNYIFSMGACTIFLSLQHTLSGILNGIGKQINASINRFIGMSVLVLCIFFLVGNETFSIKGYYVGFISSTLTICLLDIYILNSKIKIKVNIVDIIIKPLVAGIIMIGSIFILYRLYSYTAPIINITTILFGFIVYIIVLILTKALLLSNFK